MRMTDLAPGSAVVGNDGERVATISAVGQEYIVAVPRRGSGPLHIPSSAVGNVQDGVVWLNVASGEVAAKGWEAAPRTQDDPDPDSTSDLHRHV